MRQPALTLRALRVGFALVLGLQFSNCGGDSGTGPVTFENIAATYVGSMSGTSQGILLQADFSLTITQSNGSLGGSYGLTGTLFDGVNTVAVQGSGTVSGTIASGKNPSVNITVTPGLCPNTPIPFSGAYDSANHVITLNGTVPIFNPSCVVVLSYPGTIILRR